MYISKLDALLDHDQNYLFGVCELSPQARQSNKRILIYPLKNTKYSRAGKVSRYYSMYKVRLFSIMNVNLKNFKFVYKKSPQYSLQDEFQWNDFSSSQIGGPGSENMTHPKWSPKPKKPSTIRSIAQFWQALGSAIKG